MGFNGIMFTIDSAVPGKRELDIRAKPVLATKAGEKVVASKGVAGGESSRVSLSSLDLVSPLYHLFLN